MDTRSPDSSPLITETEADHRCTGQRGHLMWETAEVYGGYVSEVLLCPRPSGTQAKQTEHDSGQEGTCETDRISKEGDEHPSMVDL